MIKNLGLEAFLLLVLLFSLQVFMAQATPQNELWNGEEYSKNSNSQLTTASNFLQKLKFKVDDKVLDIGCGDGKITADIAKQLPKGSILGIDISESMIAFFEKGISKRPLSQSEF